MYTFSEKRVLVCAKVIAMELLPGCCYAVFFLLIIIIYINIFCTVVSAYCYEFIVLCGSYVIMCPSFKINTRHF